ncbi:MAG: HEAT repeat domain-containing protein [Leptospiraceae bacterium]|nr:HEAT repeat domain-containing protein [Leptospiraceae bacterium]
MLVLLLLLGVPVSGVLLKAETASEDASPASASEERAEALDAMRRQIQFAPSSERRTAIHKIKNLEETEQPPFVTLIQKLAVEDADPLVRAACIDVLTELEDSSSEQVFLKALEDRNRDVVQAALSGLTRIEAKGAGEPVARLVREEDFQENNQILGGMIRLLGKIKYTPIAPFLEEKARDNNTNPEIVQTIVLYFGRAGVNDSYDYLLELAKDSSASVTTRAYAVNSLGHLGNRNCIADLQTELQNIKDIPDSRERARFNTLKVHLLASLARLGDESVHAEILAAARDDNAGVRTRAVEQIAAARITAGRELLEYMSEHDPDRRVQQAAKKALSELNGETAEQGNDEDESQ